MNKPLRHVSGFLTPSATLAARLEQIRGDQAALHEARKALPPSLRDHCRRAVFSGNEVTLVVESAVWATRLRFMAPEILARLAQRHPEVRRCRVRIAPASSPVREPGRGHRRARLSQTTRHHLMATAEMLSDPDLAAAFRRLAGSAAPPPGGAAAAETEATDRSGGADETPPAPGGSKRG